MIRVLVVDDSPAARLAIRLILESDGELKVIGEGRNGEESVDLCRKLRPDIVTMDIMMPGMDGYEAIRRIMSEAPCPIMVLTGIESKDMATASIKALSLGALTVLPKPKTLDMDDDDCRQLIRQAKLMAAVKVVGRTLPTMAGAAKTLKTPEAASATVRHSFFPRRKGEPRVVAIGASTGGPPALHALLGGLPADFPLPILVCQHISRGFSVGLAGWLSTVTSLRCKLGEYGEAMQPGAVYCAPDGRHMTVYKNGLIALDASDPVGGHRPSIDCLFASVARNFGAAAIGILLTGMGRDGATGLKAMRQAGAFTIAQDEKSSVVFGMPAAAIELGAADEVLDLNLIALRLKSLVESKIK